ncbi:(2Fe-2S)-binding protein [Phytoactinopolyspora limicola]|uniref:(2Fe-2S)-binding protein n=1 Tax=Phytoactinopolyspora limicola TaxID=2715536 RepID=UPI00140905CF|nr:(2Fe-2S)-binding protein [Phytoactinopolyspora limicola]
MAPEGSSGTALTVNGTPVHTSVDPETPLLYLLRNDLGLKGTRFGCGQGLCGACVVLVDGHPTPSCDLPLWAAAGRDVVTVEGLASEGCPNRVQRAVLDEQAGQCGYCLSGIVVAATALLRDTPEPTADDVRTALERHLCRCGTHHRIVRAVLAAATGPGQRHDDG